MEKNKPLPNFAGPDLLQRVSEEYNNNKKEEQEQLKLASELYEKSKQTSVWSTVSSLFTNQVKIQPEYVEMEIGKRKIAEFQDVFNVFDYDEVIKDDLDSHKKNIFKTDVTLLSL